MSDSAQHCRNNCRNWVGNAAWLALAARDPHAHHPACGKVVATRASVELALSRRNARAKKGW